jgi:1-aminocyclopropane-1-carboxylate deaminase
VILHNVIKQHLSLKCDHRVDVLRLDQLHPEISGNKLFKLQLNIKEAERQQKSTLLTFGGAYSNHIAATAAAASYGGFKSIGIIRGEESSAGNHTLKKAVEHGMQLHFVDRETYKKKQNKAFEALLKETYGDFYLIPEGGNNPLGALGCKSIMQHTQEYDYVMCACGTGTTFLGLMMGKQKHQTLIGINVLKGYNALAEELRTKIKTSNQMVYEEIAGNEALNSTSIKNSCVTDQFAFSGYAAYDQPLVEFKAKFEFTHQLPLDHVYTTKLFYACMELLKENKFRKGASILVIHSGGLQGNAGFEARYFNKLMR